MISILLPSRGRAWGLKRMVVSALNFARDPDDIEIIVYVDTDDARTYANQGYPEQVKIFSTKRTVLSQYWNMACEKAKGDIFMHCGDDIVFQTWGWDSIVKAEFEKYPDKIVFVYGDDGDPAEKQFGTHGFIHKNWVDAVERFVPPYFSSDFNDTWLNEVADKIGRKVKVPILTEHMHPAFGKGEIDLTHAERYVRHHKDKNAELYESKASEREADAEKLRKVMK